MRIIVKCKNCKKEYEVINPIDFSQCPLCDNSTLMSSQEFLDNMGIKLPIMAIMVRGD